jgi:hypothetical protein
MDDAARQPATEMLFPRKSTETSDWHFEMAEATAMTSSPVNPALASVSVLRHEQYAAADTEDQEILVFSK